MESDAAKQPSQLPSLVNDYVSNLAKTINNGLSANILKLQTLSKLNAVAYETYSRSYDSLNQCLTDSGYGDNKMYSLSPAIMFVEGS